MPFVDFLLIFSVKISKSGTFGTLRPPSELFGPGQTTGGSQNVRNHGFYTIFLDPFSTHSGTRFRGPASSFLATPVYARKSAVLKMDPQNVHLDPQRWVKNGDFLGISAKSLYNPHWFCRKWPKMAIFSRFFVIF